MGLQLGIEASTLRWMKYDTGEKKVTQIAYAMASELWECFVIRRDNFHNPEMLLKVNFMWFVSLFTN